MGPKELIKSLKVILLFQLLTTTKFYLRKWNWLLLCVLCCLWQAAGKTY